MDADYRNNLDADLLKKRLIKDKLHPLNLPEDKADFLHSTNFIHYENGFREIGFITS